MDDEIKFKKAVCPYCGAVLDIEKIDKITVCEYCDGKILTDEFEILAKNSEENIAPDSDYKTKFKNWLIYAVKSTFIFSLIAFVVVFIINSCFKTDDFTYYAMIIIITVLSFSVFPYIVTLKVPVTKGQRSAKDTFYEVFHRKRSLYGKEREVWMHETKEVFRAMFAMMFIAFAIIWAIFQFLHI